MNNNITTIEHIDEAIQVCSNQVEISGILSELNIDIIKQGEFIVVKYKGVIDTNNAFIKIYGSINNNSTLFNSTINTLKSLVAEIVTMSNNGEIIDTTYHRHASFIYVRGKLSTMDSIKVDYISIENPEYKRDNKFYVVGVVEDFDIEDKRIDLFIFNSYYHQKIKIKLDDEAPKHNINRGDLIQCWFGTHDFTNQYPPIQCELYHTLTTEINKDVMAQAQQEYKIYHKSLEQTYGKSNM